METIPSQTQSSNKPLMVLDLFLALLIAGFLFAMFNSGFVPGPITRGASTVLLGVYLQFIGILFIVSYFFSNRSWILKGLMWVCEHSRGIRGRGMAFFYATLFLIIGTVLLLMGLGIVTL